MTLLAIAIAAVIAIIAELATLFILASHHQSGDATSFHLVLRQVWGTIRKCCDDEHANLPDAESVCGEPR